MKKECTLCKGNIIRVYEGPTDNDFVDCCEDCGYRYGLEKMYAEVYNPVIPNGVICNDRISANVIHAGDNVTVDALYSRQFVTHVLNSSYGLTNGVVRNEDSMR